MQAATHPAKKLKPCEEITNAATSIAIGAEPELGEFDMPSYTETVVATCATGVGVSVPSKMRAQDQRRCFYMVCHFEAESSPFKATVVDDPKLSIDDRPAERTLDDRENFIRLCAERHYQFNSMRCAKYSTMNMLGYFLRPTKMVDCVTQIVRSTTGQATGQGIKNLSDLLSFERVRS